MRFVVPHAPPSVQLTVIAMDDEDDVATSKAKKALLAPVAMSAPDEATLEAQVCDAFDPADIEQVRSRPRSRSRLKRLGVKPHQSEKTPPPSGGGVFFRLIAVCSHLEILM